MNVVMYVFLGLLYAWFFGCIVTYRIGKFTLVDGMGIKSAEFIMLALYTLCIAAYIIYPIIGKWILLGVLVFWFIVQFFCHWYYTIFGASKNKIQGYNKCFENTFRLFPFSEKRIVPDFYHMVLHLLIAINILLSCLQLF